jgi:hypothetical protein
MKKQNREKGINAFKPLQKRQNYVDVSYCTINSQVASLQELLNYLIRK